MKIQSHLLPLSCASRQFSTIKSRTLQNSVLARLVDMVKFMNSSRYGGPVLLVRRELWQLLVGGHSKL